VWVQKNKILDILVNTHFWRQLGVFVFFSPYTHTMFANAVLLGISLAFDAPVSFLQQRTADLRFGDDEWEDDDDDAADFDPEIPKKRGKHFDTLSDVLNKGDTAALQKLLNMVENVPDVVRKPPTKGAEKEKGMKKSGSVGRKMDRDVVQENTPAPSDLDMALDYVDKDEGHHKPTPPSQQASLKKSDKKEDDLKKEDHGTKKMDQTTANVTTGEVTTKMSIKKQSEEDRSSTSSPVSKDKPSPSSSSSSSSSFDSSTSSSFPSEPRTQDLKLKSSSSSTSAPMNEDVEKAKKKASNPTNEATSSSFSSSNGMKMLPSKHHLQTAVDSVAHVKSVHDAAGVHDRSASREKGERISSGDPKEFKAVITDVGQLKYDLESLGEKELRLHNHASVTEMELAELRREKQEADAQKKQADAQKKQAEAVNEVLLREKREVVKKLLRAQEREKLDDAKIVDLKEKNKKDATKTEAHDKMMQGEIEGLRNDLLFQKKETEVRKNVYQGEMEKLERELEWMQKENKKSHTNVVDLKHKLANAKAQVKQASRTIKRLTYLRHVVDEESRRARRDRRERLRDERRHRASRHWGIRSNEGVYGSQGNEWDDE